MCYRLDRERIFDEITPEGCDCIPKQGSAAEVGRMLSATRRSCGKAANFKLREAEAARAPASSRGEGS